MSDAITFTQHAHKYRDVIQEYCDISAQGTLCDQEADRIEAILAAATTDPMLSFLIDEADHMLSHLYRFIDEETITQEQNKLRDKLEASWVDQVLLDASTRLKDAQRKNLQQYLKEKGFYTGSVDGVVGPQTEAAIQNCSESGDLAHQLSPIHSPEPQDC